MKAVFFLFGLLLPFFGNAGQHPDSGLNNSLLRPKDSAGIDRLNALSLRAIENSLKDSAGLYSAAAYDQAKAINYIHGMAAALSMIGFEKTFFYGDLAAAEIWDKAAVDEYALTTNKSGLGSTYERLTFVCFGQSNYDEAIKYSEAAYGFYKEHSDSTGMSGILQLITQIYLKRGEFAKAFEAGQRALQISIRRGHEVEVKGCLLGLGTVCMGIEDYPLALNYYRSVFQNFSTADSLSLIKSEDLVWAKMEYAEIYSHLGRFDSALYRYNLLDTTRISEKDLRVFLVSKGEYFMLMGRFDEALPFFVRGLAFHRELNDGNEIVRTVLDLSATWFGLHKTDSALRYAREGLLLGSKASARQRMRDAYKMLYSIYESRGRTDSAFFYYRNYVQTKESLTDDQVKGKFAAEEYLGRIANLSSEKSISEQRLKFQDQLLKKQRLIRNILIALVCLVFIGSLLLLRNLMLKRKNEQLINDHSREELVHKTNEMEMQALRAQMNPHFIFNCLNSINRFIMKNESQAASDYLTQFSRLIRLVLINSKKAWIPIDDEIDMLGLYLGMEKLRFKDAFDYHIYCEDGIDKSSLCIPPMLLQPFVENAVWHGLMHKKENGLVSVSFRMDDEVLHCSVEDNGIGRSAAAKAGSKSVQAHKSLGLRITAERLALINRQSDNERVSFSIQDLVDRNGLAAGTKIDLRIRLRENADVFREAEGSIKTALS